MSSTSTAYKGKPQVPASGDPDVILAYEWRRTGGPTVQIAREGSYVSLMAMVPELKLSYDAISIKQKQSGGWFRLEAAQNADGITDIHEVTGSNLSQAKGLNQNIRGNFPSLTSGAIDKIIAKVKAEVLKVQQSTEDDAVDVAWENVKRAIELQGGVTSLEYCADLVREFSNGSEFLNTQYTYRHTVVCAERYFSDVANTSVFADAYKYVHQIFTEDQLRTAELIPATFVFPPQVSDGAKKGEWLKEPSHCELTYNQKRTITSEYTFADSWSRILYKVKN